MKKFSQPARSAHGEGHAAPSDETVVMAGRDGLAPSGSVLRPVLAGEFVAGGLMTLVIFAYSLSFASLVFSGPLAGHVGIAVAATLGSAGLATTISAFFSSMRFAIVAPDTPVIAILGALAASLVVAGGPGLTENEAVAHAIGAFALCAATTGVALLAVGAFKLSKWVRFVPHTVVAAFLGASGWFLVTGAATMAAGTPIDSHVLSGADESAALRLGVALAAATALWAVRAATRAPLSTPVLFLCGMFVFAAWVHLSGVDPDGLRADGWVFQGAGVAIDGLPPILLAAAAPPAWEALAPFLPEILTISGVATLAILLNATGLEAQTGQDADLDREYVVSGSANIAIAALGGLPSNLSLNRSSMSFFAGGRTGVSAIVAAAGCVCVAVFAEQIAAVAPKPLLAGMLLVMGGNMLWRWLIATFYQFEVGDWLTAIAIFGLIVLFGYVEGAALGLIVACLSFAFSYGRTPFVRLAMTRSDCASYVERARTEEAALRHHGARVLVYRLQGYLFFGSAHRVAHQVQDAVRDAPEPISSVLLDFRFVTGMDASADAALERLCRRLRDGNVRICLTDLEHGRWSRALDAFVHDDPDGLACFATLDAGLEWCEGRLVEDLGKGKGGRRSVEDWLTSELGREHAGDVIDHMSKRSACAGQKICQQGEPAQTVIFANEGRISIHFEQEGAPPLLLKTMTGEAVIGEIGFFKQLPRSASVVAETDAEYYEIDRAQFDRLLAEKPRACAALQALIIRVLADRLVFANRELAVQRR